MQYKSARGLMAWFTLVYPVFHLERVCSLVSRRRPAATHHA